MLKELVESEKEYVHRLKIAVEVSLGEKCFAESFLMLHLAFQTVLFCTVSMLASWVCDLGVCKAGAWAIPSHLWRMFTDNDIWLWWRMWMHLWLWLCVCVSACVCVHAVSVIIET